MGESSRSPEKCADLYKAPRVRHVPRGAFAFFRSIIPLKEVSRWIGNSVELLLAAMVALVSFDPGELAAQEKCKS